MLQPIIELDGKDYFESRFVIGRITTVLETAVVGTAFLARNHRCLLVVPLRKGAEFFFDGGGNAPFPQKIWWGQMPSCSHGSAPMFVNEIL